MPMGMQPAEVDTRGRFTIEGLPAGEYELQLRVFGPNTPPNAPPHKQNVSVPEGGETPVTLTLNLATLNQGNTP
jgi:hypothetical protein